MHLIDKYLHFRDSLQGRIQASPFIIAFLTHRYINHQTKIQKPIFSYIIQNTVVVGEQNYLFLWDLSYKGNIWSICELAALLLFA
jgi:hypothetical protein